LTNIKSMKKSKHSWKGKIEINGTEYFWEQFTTTHESIHKVVIYQPIQTSFEFETHKNSLGNKISETLKMLNHSH
jgi:hypothetical protein